MTATTRPTKLGQPFTRWSQRKLVAYPHPKREGHPMGRTPSHRHGLNDPAHLCGQNQSQTHPDHRYHCRTGVQVRSA